MREERLRPGDYENPENPCLLFSRGVVRAQNRAQELSRVLDLTFLFQAERESTIYTEAGFQTD